MEESRNPENEEEGRKNFKKPEFKEKREVQNQPSNRWTLVHGFYAQMGAFVLDTTGVCPDFLPETRTTLYLKSFRFLLEHAAKPFVEPQRNTYRESSEELRQDQQLIQEHESEENQAQHLSNSDICVGLDVSRTKHFRSFYLCADNLCPLVAQALER